MRSTTHPHTPKAQREELLDAQRKAHKQQPRSVKDDALRDKVISVEPDGTGPTPTGSFDPEADSQAGSGGRPASR